MMQHELTFWDKHKFFHLCSSGNVVRALAKLVQSSICEVKFEFDNSPTYTDRMEFEEALFPVIKWIVRESNPGKDILFYRPKQTKRQKP